VSSPSTHPHTSSPDTNKDTHYTHTHILSLSHRTCAFPLSYRFAHLTHSSPDTNDTHHTNTHTLSLTHSPFLSHRTCERNMCVCVFVCVWAACIWVHTLHTHTFSLSLIELAHLTHSSVDFLLPSAKCGEFTLRIHVQGARRLAKRAGVRHEIFGVKLHRLSSKENEKCETRYRHSHTRTHKYTHTLVCCCLAEHAGV